MQPGDNLWYLLDREVVTTEDLETLNDDELSKMVGRWLKDYDHRFFVTCARNFRPGAAPGGLNTFDCHDSTVLYPDRSMLLEAMASLAEQSRGSAWVVIVVQDVGAAISDAVKGLKSH
jgi:hypothetical protein